MQSQQQCDKLRDALLQQSNSSSEKVKFMRSTINVWDQDSLKIDDLIFSICWNESKTSRCHQALRLQFSGAITLSQQEKLSQLLKDQNEAKAKLRQEIEKTIAMRRELEVSQAAVEIEKNSIAGTNM